MWFFRVQPSKLLHCSWGGLRVASTFPWTISWNTLHPFFAEEHSFGVGLRYVALFTFNTSLMWYCLFTFALSKLCFFSSFVTVETLQHRSSDVIIMLRCHGSAGLRECYRISLLWNLIERLVGNRCIKWPLYSTTVILIRHFFSSQVYWKWTWRAYSSGAADFPSTQCNFAWRQHLQPKKEDQLNAHVFVLFYQCFTFACARVHGRVCSSWWIASCACLGLGFDVLIKGLNCWEEVDLVS